ncbi:hypothetical protein A1704_23495 [Chryseobacterium cucumeris]|nr:hypothetical protein A1704_23495 [Chryseobacterium cucumeris]
MIKESFKFTIVTSEILKHIFMFHKFHEIVFFKIFLLAISSLNSTFYGNEKGTLGINFSLHDLSFQMQI